MPFQIANGGVGVPTTRGEIGLTLRALLVVACACLLVALSGVAWAQPTASNVRLGEHPEHTRFVLELSETVDYRIFTLRDPDRIVIELPDIAWKLPANAGVRGGGLIRSYRYGVFAEGRSRIVLDLVDPARVATHFVMPPEGGKPARLVLDLKPTSKDEFDASAGWPEDARPPSPQVAADTPIQTRDGRFIVVIDPGHGGVDPGATGPNGIHEKDVVLEMALALKAELQKREGYTVVLTRENDIFLPLKERVNFARLQKADLFISIHADSIDGGGVKGASIYTLSEVASDKEAAELARKENAADIIAGVDLSTEDEAVTNILIDLAQRETNNRSVMFARLALPEIARHTSLLNKPHRFAGLVVLKAPDVPSILVECGFLSNADEEDNLNSPKWRRGMGRALAKSVDVYYERMHAVAQTDARHQTAH